MGSWHFAEERLSIVPRGCSAYQGRRNLDYTIKWAVGAVGSASH